MGEFTRGMDNLPHSEFIANKRDTQGGPGEVETEVDGVFADGTKDNLPIFDVSKDEFYRNMKYDRKRVRFSSDASVTNYLRGSRYRRPFFVRTKTDNGDYIRKVK